MRKLNRKEQQLVARVWPDSKLKGFDAKVHYQRQPTHNSLREAALLQKNREDAGVDYDPLTVTVATVKLVAKSGSVTIRNGVAKRCPWDTHDAAVGEGISFARALRAKPIKVA